MKRMIMILAALVAVNVYADYIPKDYRKTEVTDTIRPRTIKQVQASSWQLYWSFEQDGVDIPLTNATSVYLKINDDDQTWTTTITGSVDSATNAFVQVNPADLNTNGEFEFTLTAENSTSVLAYAYGELILQAMAGSGITNPLVATTNINWADYVYSGTEVSGPVRPDGVTISATANADGSIIITTTGSATNTTVVMPGTMIDVTTNMQHYTVNHADTSALSSIDNSGQNVLIDLDIDSRGHVTNAASTNLALVFDTIASVNAKVIAVSNIMNIASNDLSAEITTATNDIYGDALSAANSYTDSATNDIIGDGLVLAKAYANTNVMTVTDSTKANQINHLLVGTNGQWVAGSGSLDDIDPSSEDSFIVGEIDAVAKIGGSGDGNGIMGAVTGSGHSIIGGASSVGSMILGRSSSGGKTITNAIGAMMLGDAVGANYTNSHDGSITIGGINSRAKDSLAIENGMYAGGEVRAGGDLYADGGDVFGTSTNATYLGNLIASSWSTDAERIAGTNAVTDHFIADDTIVSNALEASVTTGTNAVTGHMLSETAMVSNVLNGVMFKHDGSVDASGNFNIAGFSITNVGTILVTNQLGVGTTSPASTLDVNGAATIRGTATFNDNVGLGAAPSYPLNIFKSGPSWTVSGETNYDIVMGFRNSGGRGLLYGGNSVNNASFIQNSFSGGSMVFATRIAPNNYERMRITAEGNVGIGTNAPDSNLQVNTTDSTALMNLTSNGTDVVKVLANGNVGIGTATPDANLEIAAAEPVIHLDAGANANIHLDKGAANRQANVWFSTAGVAKWYTGLSDSDYWGDGEDYYIGTAVNVPLFVIDDDTGNVGIGTNAPAAKLHVAGTMQVDNFICEADFIDDGTQDFTGISGFETITNFAINICDADYSATHSNAIVNVAGRYRLYMSLSYDAGSASEVACRFFTNGVAATTPSGNVLGWNRSTTAASQDGVIAFEKTIPIAAGTSIDWKIDVADDETLTWKHGTVGIQRQ